MSDPAAKLVRMANQIANEFSHQQGANVVEATWDHLWHFWDPEMRRAIVVLEADGGAGLTETAAAAVRRLATGQRPEPQTRATEFGKDRTVILQEMQDDRSIRRSDRRLWPCRDARCGSAASAKVPCRRREPGA